MPNARRINGGWRTAFAGLLAVGTLALGAAQAAHAQGLETVMQDDAQLLHRSDDQLRRSLEEMKLLGVDRIRVTAGWSVLTRDADSEVRPTFDATDPAAYEQERWRNLDRLLVMARQYGFKTMIDIAFWAPAWASHDAAGERGRTEVDTEEFRKFAVAVARRYSGSFVIPAPVQPRSGPLPPSKDEQYLNEGFGTTSPDGPTSLHAGLGLPLLASASGVGAEQLTETLGAPDARAGSAGAATLPLPKVDVYTIWNEPNHTSFLRPQWVKHGHRWLPRSPHVYREMVLKSYPAIKAVRPDATILIGGTSFSGAYGNRGVGNVPPLQFIREMACVNKNLNPMGRSGCAGFTTIPGDGFAHHPYSLRTEPDARNRVTRPDDVPVAELPKLVKLLDQLVAKGRLSPGARNLWITEYGYETNPPDPEEPFSVGDQARFLTWAEYLTWRVPNVKSFAQFLLRDLPPQAFRVGSSKNRPFGEWQSGLLFENGVPKLAAYSFRAGLYAQENARGRVRFWGRLRLGPGPHAVVIERRPPRADAWSPLPTSAAGQTAGAAQFTVDGKDAFLRFAASAGKGWRYRIRYQDGDVWRASPSVAAVQR